MSYDSYRPLAERFTAALEKLASWPGTLWTLQADFLAALHETDDGYNGPDALDTLTEAAGQSTRRGSYPFAICATADFLSYVAALKDNADEAIKQLNESVYQFSLEGTFDMWCAQYAERMNISESEARRLMDDMLNGDNANEQMRKTFASVYDPDRIPDGVRGDRRGGILEYCAEDDYDYVFSTVLYDVMDEDNDSFAPLAKEFADMEKTDETDRIIEAISALLPRLYGYCPDLIALHSDKAIPNEKYGNAFGEREDTAPETPRLTKNVFPDLKPVRYGENWEDDEPDEEEEDYDIDEVIENTVRGPSFFRRLALDLEKMHPPYFWIVTILSFALFGGLFGFAAPFVAGNVALVSAISIFIAVLNIFNLILYIAFSDHERKWIGIVVLAFLILLWFYVPTFLEENYMNYL